MSNDNVIIGAGLAGLITAHVMPKMPLIDAALEPRATHKALLRFRGPEVGELTGIEFRPVTVHKSVWYAREHSATTIMTANLYAQKVIGLVSDRSIWRLDPVTRWIAPETFYEQLIDALDSRIKWGTNVDDRVVTSGDVSTIPLPVMLDHLGIERPVEFRHAPIKVQRYRVPGADVFQTVYYPDPDHTLYRASITGDLLVAEFAGVPFGSWSRPLFESFGIDGAELVDSPHEQRYGKIAPIDEHIRKSIVAKITMDHGVFSVGRFATWRNILLDDVAHDAHVVKRLANATDYERRLALL